MTAQSSVISRAGTEERRRRDRRNLRQASLAFLEKAAELAILYGPITVRGVAYKLLVAGVLASMKKSETNRVSSILTYAREQGIVPWDKIVDESRQVERPGTWTNLAQFTGIIARAYRKDHWATQPYCVQVWSEKATVGGVLRPVLQQYGVPFLVIHGFSSISALHDIAESSAADPRPWKILYCGDHDASGMFISEIDIPDGLARYEGQATIHRVALTADDLPGLPANEPNTNDKRWQWYCTNYGERVWELDALSPDILRDHVEEAIRSCIDWPKWHASERVEQTEQRKIQQIVRAFRNGSKKG